MDAPAPAPAVRWETVPCPLCRSADADPVLAVPAADAPGGAYHLLRCNGCGLGYLNPRPDEATIGHYYPPGYDPYQAPERAAGGGIRGFLRGLVLRRYHGYPPPVAGWRKALAAAARPWFRPSRHSMTDLPFVGAGRLLDYGCGSGWYAERMRARGWAVTGMDFNPEAVAAVRRRYTFPVLAGTLPHPDVRPGSFDVVTLGAVLEHVHDPHRLIAAAADALAPGGRLVASVPNLGGWGFRTFGRHWFGLELPRHLLHFTPATLRRLVEAHGLVVRELTTPVRASCVRQSVKAARRAGGPDAGRWVVRLGRVRVVSSYLAHRSGRRGDADTVRVIAEKPAAVAAPALSRAA